MPLFNKMHIELTLDDVQKKIHLEEPKRVQPLIDSALRLMDPKAVYAVAHPESKTDTAVVIAGSLYQSTVLRKNLEGVNRVFPFVVTIGEQLEAETGRLEDFLDTYLLDKIGDLILRQARQQLQEHLQTAYALKNLSRMSPGSLPDWPIEEQKKLFALLGDVQGVLGVRLNESLLMLPRKSVSGLFFPTEIGFYSCQLCPLKNCEARKAAYNKDKAKEYGVLPES